MFFKDKSNPEGQSSQEGHGGRGGRGVDPAGDLMGQPDLKEVEEEYWHLVTERDSHVQVQQGSIGEPNF